MNDRTALHRTIRTSRAALALASAALGAAFMAGPATGQPAAAAPAEAPVPGPPVADVNALLSALEKADVGLRSLAADISYDRQLRLQGDRHVRRGKLFFRSEEAQGGGRPQRSFAVGFTHLFIGDRMEHDPQFWIFDGQWLVEKKDTSRQFIKRRVAPPNADFDPLRIGEGPMPIPIGQRAADILARYDAELRPAADIFVPGAPMAAFVADCHQLRLTPKPHRAEEDEFVEIRLWYRWEESAQRFLPRASRVTTRSGDESYVQLINVEVNPKINPVIFDMSAPPQNAGWDVQIIDELQDRGSDNGAR